MVDIAKAFDCFNFNIQAVNGQSFFRAFVRLRKSCSRLEKPYPKTPSTIPPNQG
jgi:hypothetical protein